LGIRPSYEKTIIIDEKNYDPTDMRVIGDRKIGKTYIVKMKDFDSDLKSSGNVVFPAIVASKARIE
jgi:Fe-S-cluster formation regulator IscX/YfhJ